MIADALRRAHLVDRLPWSQLAVIVRSASAAAALSRSLAVAGVPVQAPTTGGPVGAQPGARALLSVLEATVAGLDGERAQTLLTGPIGRVDPVSLRQLRRALRRHDAGLAEALTGSAAPALPVTLAGPVNRVRAVLCGCGAQPRAATAIRATRCGRCGSAAVCSGAGCAPLNAAGSTARSPSGTWALSPRCSISPRTTSPAPRGRRCAVCSTMSHALQLPPVADIGAAGAAVAVLSPHAALDRDWEMVVIAGLQDGLWPNTTPRGGVLGTQRLLDVLDGLGDEVSARAPLLAEERRLLIAAMGRARRRLLITAVDSDAGDAVSLPSPFIAELAAHAGGDRAGAAVS